MIRYALTFVNSAGLRVLAHDNNGRNTWLTKKDGDKWLKTMLETNSTETVSSIFGDNPQFKVNQVICYSNGEAVTTVFED